MTREERQRRRFSDTFKREKVEQLELGLVTITQLSREYDVSRSAVYDWKAKYGKEGKDEWTVVEKKSEATKTKYLRDRLSQREREIGLQQIELRYLKEVIEYWSRELGEDLEKKVERPL